MGLPRSTVLASVVVLIVIGGFSAAYFSGWLGGPVGGQSPTSGASIQGGNQTIDATLVSTISSTSSTTASTTTTSTQSTTSGSSYSYPPSSDVKILSVSAVVSQGQSGSRAISFKVQFQNVGSSDIYVMGGGGSSLNATIVSGPVTEQAHSLRCLIATAEVSVAPQGEYTSVTPGCWSGYSFWVTGSGTIQVQLTLTWSTGGSYGGGSYSTVVSAEFNVA